MNVRAGSPPPPPTGTAAHCEKQSSVVRVTHTNLRANYDQ